jgi:hypothetical protein
LAGTVKLMRVSGMTHAMRSGAPGSCGGGNAGDLGPRLESLGSGSSILVGGDVIAAEMEEVVDPVMGEKEALCLAGGLEELHLSLSSSGGLVRVLHPV